MEKFLKTVYYDPGNPAGFGSINKLVKAAKDAGFSRATYKIVKEWLQGQEVYATTVPAAKVIKTRGHVKVDSINAQFEQDLIDFSKYGKENEDYRYVLLTIDTLSRFCMARKLKTKTGKEVAREIDDMFSKERSPKYIVRTDRGQEFLAFESQQVYKKFGLYHMLTHGELKATYIERLVKTIKGRIFKYFQAQESHRWIDIIEQVVSAYNRSVHRVIKMRPIDVTEANQGLAMVNQFRTRNGLDKYGLTKQERGAEKLKKKGITTKTAANPPAKQKFQPGDKVRISELRSKFSREYSQKWSSEIFTVERVYFRDGVTPIYILKDWSGDPVEGTFYSRELTHAKESASAVYKIEKVLDTRLYRGQKQVRVKWLNWHKKFSSWIPASEVKDIKGKK